MASEVQLEKSDLRELIEVLRASESPRFIKPYHKVFCNRNLALREIEAIGFDMDYTLALYHQEVLDRLTHEKTVERLISQRGYPESILSIEPRSDFAIRGLCVDKELGNVFKMDSGRHAGKVFHGFRELTPAESAAYHRTPIRFTERFALIDTLFGLPEVFVFSALIDHFERFPEEREGRTPRQIFEDVRHCIDLCHSDDSLKDAISADPSRYIVRDPMLAPTLHRFRSSGKRLFLMTNSYPKYTEAVMSYLLDGVLSEYPSWRTYFDVIITGAKKPNFFTDALPFYRVDDATHELIGEEHERLERGRMYQHGNIVELEQMMGCGGPQILYVGDHIYGDILRSKRTSAWRTCMIVQEMHEELARTDTVRHEISERNELEQELERINDEIFFISTLERRFDDFVTGLPGVERDDEVAVDTAPGPQLEPTRVDLKLIRKDLRFRVDTLKRRQRQVLTQITALSREIEQNFNTWWGLVFKEGNECSIFGKQVQDYADLYTSRVSNLASYSPLHSFRSPVDLLPHEL